MKKINFLSEYDQSILEDFIRSADDNIVVFIGAGVSHGKPSNFPLWITVYDRLLVKANKLHPSYIEELNLIEQLKQIGDTHSLLNGFEKLKAILGENVYSTTIRKEFRCIGNLYPPILDTIITRNIKGIITTNIDCLIETAHNHLVANGNLENPLQIISTFDYSAANEILHHKDWLWKIHGTLDNPNTWVFTLSDYYRSEFTTNYIESLINVFHNTRVLFIGYSAKDIDLLFMLDKLNKRFGTSINGHILLTQDSEGFDLALLAEYGIDVISYGGDNNHSNLKKIIETFPSKKKEVIIKMNEGINKYREFIIEKTDNMYFKGIEFFTNYRNNNKFSVINMYTDLYIKNFHGISDSAVSLQDFVSSERGVIIKGEPGSGKSTFIKYFVRHNVEKKSSVIPFIISLEPFGRYLDECSFSQKKEAVDIIIMYLREEYPQPQFLFQEKDFENIFLANECWLFFDGFDEINSTATKRKVLHLIQVLYDVCIKCKFVITTRPYALDEFSEIDNFQNVYIDVLNRSQMEQYINTLSVALNINQYLIDVNGLISLISKSNILYQLARTHVMLTFICIIYFSKENIPDSRYKIFEKIITWLISSKEKDKKIIQEQVLLYSNIAYYMSIEKRKEIIEGTLYEKFGDSQKEYDFIKKVKDTGILIKKTSGNENKIYSFWHFCFQEYLAARFISDKIYETKDFQFIIDKWFDTDYQDIIVLVSSSLLSHSLTLMQLLVNEVSKFLCSFSIEQTIKGAGLLGKIMEEVFPNLNFLNECSEWIKLKTKLETIFFNPLTNVGLINRYNAAVAYGLSGDNRLSNFNNTFIKIQRGKFYMGAQKDFHWGRNYDPYATEFEFPVKEITLEEFYIRKYPITVEEYEQFIQSDGYSYLDEIWTPEGILWRKENNILYPRNWRSQICLRNCPVTGISWYEAVAYCNWLTTIYHDDYIYRLPSEAEWEYAYKVCYHGKFQSPLDINCYVDSEYLQFKTPIGMFPNSTAINGVTDMLGNVEEWCADSWSTSLVNCPRDGKAWICNNEDGAVTRGGSTVRTRRLCRGTYRGRCNKNTRYDTIGFRIIKEKR